MNQIRDTAQMIPELRKVLKWLHYPLEVMQVCAHCYAVFPLRFRDLYHHANYLPLPHAETVRS